MEPNDSLLQGRILQLRTDGAPGAPGMVVINGERVDTRAPQHVGPGSLVLLRTPGGGGFGPPDRRTQEARRRDMEEGYV